MALLDGRYALVTGATGGIGGAIALALAEAGAKLVLAGRDGSRLAEVAARAGGALAVAGDLTSPEDAEALAGAAEGVDILVHSAGSYARGDDPDVFEAQLGANLVAPYRLTQLLLDGLDDLVFINSSQGLAASPGVAQFAATQHGLRALADALRGEVNSRGVRVLSVHVGRTATSRQERIFEMEGRPYTPERLMQPEDVAQIVLAGLILPRTAEMTSVSIRPMQKV
ncbi:MAG TPA: SDR family NAD(P)-dependent oxidoreductase [Nocardioides sp.]|nr:SDR family NAD(P)-dependent oxidoreductase [Nocardioides sp.]